MTAAEGLPHIVAQGDPSDTDFVDDLVEAIRALAALGRPSRTVDRSRIAAERRLRRSAFGYLAKKKIIIPTGTYEDERTLIQDVADLAATPDALLAHLWERVGIARGGRRQASVYIEAIHEHLHTWAGARSLDVQTNGRGHILASSRDWKAILWPAIQGEADRWIALPDRHRWVHHLRSSQCFALNLFGPIKLGLPWAIQCWSSHFPGAALVEFEFPHDGDPLSETKLPERLARTRVDVRLDGGASDTWLVEVKLTEPEFGPCSAGHDPKNNLRSSSCDAEFKSLEALQKNCYLHGLGRRYFPMLMSDDSLVDAAKLAVVGSRGCPLRGDLYQIVRNLLLVQHVRATEGRRARFAVVAPSRELNPTLHEAGGGAVDLARFLRSILKEHEQDAVTVIDFAGVVEAAEQHSEQDAQNWAAFMRERYLSPLVAGRRAVLAARAGR